MADFTVLEYCYRDASNYRVHEWILLSGSLTREGEARLRASLIHNTWFVAEEVGLNSLRPKLEEVSGGATPDDHAWHELIRVRQATVAEIAKLPVECSVEEIVGRFEFARGARGQRS